MGLSLPLRNLTRNETSLLNFAQYYASHERWMWLPIRGALMHEPPSESLPLKIKHLAETGLIKVHADRPLDVIEDQLLTDCWYQYTADWDDDVRNNSSQEQWAEFCWQFHQKWEYWPPESFDDKRLCYQRSFFLCPADVEPIIGPEACEFFD